MPSTRPRPLAALALLLALSSAAGAALDSDGHDFADLGFLEGSWRGDTWHTHYSGPEGGMILSASKELGEDGRVAFFEYERIVEDEQGIALIPSPFGKPSVRFPLVDLDPAARWAAFENPDHDFPQRIEYQRVSEGMLVFRLWGQRGGEPVASTTKLYRWPPARD